MILKKHLFFCILSLFLISFLDLKAQQESLSDIKVRLQNDTLYLQNKYVSFTYLWNNGNLILKEAKENTTAQKLEFSNNKIPSLYLPKEGVVTSEAKMEVEDKRTFPNEYIHKEVSIYFKMASLEVKHRIKIYPNASAISHVYFLKGRAKASVWVKNREVELKMIEKNHQNDATESERIGNIPFDGNHWKTSIISFKEATDYHDNLVFEKEILPYRKKQEMSGNILLGIHPRKNTAFFLIKEAPIAHSQQYYAGYDFQIDHKSITVHGIGIAPKDLNNEWIQGYGYAIGLAKANTTELQKTLLTYQKQLRKHIPERDGMILANTWGDRSKDSRMNETFILKEIEQASKIGITHLQLDDGWQTGLSRNSASKAGQKWDDWSLSDWQPHPERFPNGFKNIIATAKKKNVKICLWFNPSKANSYQFWERDADILMDYYHRYGIKVFKIDGISFVDKQSEINLRKLFTKVMLKSKGQVTFNMDVTAGHRVGYHYFNEFGNIFLENRYTDWGNYYPHRTLRNLWKLSGYVPTQRLQIEFLNNSRNSKKYPIEDVLAPQKIPLTYTSAITLVGQPLAWMEVSNLSNIENLKNQLTVYKNISNSLHSCIVLPIGEEPSGFSHTGFIAYDTKRPKYIVLYNEYTEQEDFKLQIHGLKPEFNFNRILGNTMSIHKDQEDSDKIRVNTKKPFDYGLFSID